MSDPSQKPVVSILMPVHAAWDGLEETVESIHSQTFQDWELFIGVWGQPDRSEPFLAARAMEGDRVSAFDQSHRRSQAACIATLAALVTGQWIELIHPGAVWPPDYLEKLYATSEQEA